MGKHRDHLRSGRERFEDGEQSFEPLYFQRELSSPRPASHAENGPLDSSAEVLWFNASKGFGFVKLADGTEAFLHISKLQAVGKTTLPEGAKLQAVVEIGPKGKPQVSRIVAIESDEASSKPLKSMSAGFHEDEVEAVGSVVRYDRAKGYGFIKLASDGKDVFVHATALAKSGLSELTVGQAVQVRFVKGAKGLEARTLHAL